MLGIAAQASFRAVAILPAILLIVFGAIWFYDRSKGGFKPLQTLTSAFSQPLRGSFRVLVLYDIAEQIDLDRLGDAIGVARSRREPTFKHPAPEYVRFERSPVLSISNRCYSPRANSFSAALSTSITASSAWNWNALSRRIGKTGPPFEPLDLGARN